MTTFRVRSMTQDEAWWMWDRAIDLGREITYGDPESFWAIDETGYFVGELDGKIISCIACLKYSDTLAQITMYMVDEEYRGKGYGLKTFNAAMQSIPSGCNVGLMASPDHEAMYQRSGFKQYWRVRYMTFNISKVASIECTQPNNVIIHPISSNTSTVLAEAITDYDSKCFFTARPKFIKERLFSANEATRGSYFVALDQTNGAVVGLIVVKQPISDKVSSYQVGPFYADSIEIATYLLHYACTYLISKGLARQNISLFYPENNPNASVLADKFKAIHATTIILCMFTSVPPSYLVECVYGISAPATG